MPETRCLNCDTRLAGPYCHVCGQPVKGMVRHFRSVVGDFLDTVFEYDSRIWRTLLPLYCQPGRMTRDFLAGRRIRFVTPFRLMFVLLVLAFLVLQLAMESATAIGPADDEPGIFDATTVADAQAARDRTLAGLDEALAESLADGDDPQSARERIELARRAVMEDSQRRIDWIEAAAAARREGREPPPEARPMPRLYLDDDGEIWDPVTNPLVIGWLPDAANRQVNDWIGRGVDNAAEAQQHPERFVDAFLGLLPAVLFALLPVFALLLKVLYVFTGRLYMEHMVVALHSHAFLGLALMVSTTLEYLALAAPAALGLQTGLHFVHGLSLAWIPVYLLIMQRRVYAQGWPLTLLKFAVLGGSYGMLLLLALAFTALVTLVRG